MSGRPSELGDQFFVAEFIEGGIDSSAAFGPVQKAGQGLDHVTGETRTKGTVGVGNLRKELGAAGFCR